MNDKMREEFEEYFTENGKWPRSVEKNSDGHYLLSSAASSWPIWQAARDSVGTHESGVNAMTRKLREILDGMPCIFSDPPELAEVAQRLASHPEPQGLELPELPEPDSTDRGWIGEEFGDIGNYTADQMRAYAITARANALKGVELPAWPESITMQDILEQAPPASWDDDLKREYERGAVARENLRQMKAYARQLRDAISARAAPPSAPVAPEVWQPIETAPIEGREMFIVIGFNVEGSYGCRYDTNPYFVRRQGFGFVDWPHHFRPTHWMPLPKPPEPTK